MKQYTLILAGALGLFIAAMTLPAFASDDSAKDKEVTITGEAKCAKCTMHTAKKCQTVITAEVDGKSVDYYLTPNDKAKDFHDTICKESKKVTATGTVTTKGDKQMLTVTKIEEAK